MTTIFVLEDDPDLRRLYTRALAFRGYQVDSTDSAESAISMIDCGDCAPDIAVLDMSMPGLPGSAVVNYIRYESQQRDIPIIVISCNEDFRQEVEQANVVFMTKPIDLSDLYKVVERYAH
jgi:DNA-binding response OmpR family regulator